MVLQEVSQAIQLIYAHCTIWLPHINSRIFVLLQMQKNGTSHEKKICLSLFNCASQLPLLITDKKVWGKLPCSLALQRCQCRPCLPGGTSQLHFLSVITIMNITTIEFFVDYHNFKGLTVCKGIHFALIQVKGLLPPKLQRRGLVF